MIYNSEVQFIYFNDSKMFLWTQLRKSIHTDSINSQNTVSGNINGNAIASEFENL